MNTLVIGSIGASIILVAFILNVTKHLHVRSKTYLWMNIVGSMILIYYAYLLSSIPFAVLNTVWVLAAVWGLLDKA